MKLDYWQENFFKVNLILLILIFFLMSCSDQIEQEHDAATFNSLIEEYDFHSSKINIVIKDNIDIKGRPTTAGSLALEGNIAKDNAYLVQKLLDNNFHIAGKANLSEWANFRSYYSVSGWSSLGGQTYNIVGLDFNPCGSSSGSAVAVAVGIVDVAIGTETNGSISCPSSVNGIVGMKPTVGLVSRTGIIPISVSQDTAGPMGKNVTIVARTLEAIAGYDPKDSATAEIPQNFDFNFLENLKQSSLKGKRLGVLQSDLSDRHANDLLNKLQTILKQAGAEVVLLNDQRAYPYEDEYFLLKYEFKTGLEDYLLNATESKKTLEEIIYFNEQNAETVMPFFGQEILLESLETENLIEQYQRAIDATQKTKAETIAFLKSNKLDAFVGLTRGPAWKINYEGGDDKAMDDVPSFSMGGFAAISGLPHLTVPFFQMEQFPIGVSFIGLPWSDKRILELGAALERELTNYDGKDFIAMENTPIKSSFLIIDVRSDAEVLEGQLQDSVHIEWTQIADSIDTVTSSKDQQIYLYCRSGGRAGRAELILKDLGYQNVENLGSIEQASNILDKKILKLAN